MDMVNIRLQTTPKAAINSDTSSSYNDSCYGSSEMDVCHHPPPPPLPPSQPPHSTNRLTGKILLSSDEKYIILCKETPSSQDETNSTASSSSPTGANSSTLVTRYQRNVRTGTRPQYRTQLEPSNANLEFFQNNHEYRKILESSTSFHCRKITPQSEYHL